MLEVSSQHRKGDGKEGVKRTAFEMATSGKSFSFLCITSAMLQAREIKDSVLDDLDLGGSRRVRIRWNSSVGSLGFLCSTVMRGYIKSGSAATDSNQEERGKKREEKATHVESGSFAGISLTIKLSKQSNSSVPLFKTSFNPVLTESRRRAEVTSPDSVMTINSGAIGRDSLSFVKVLCRFGQRTGQLDVHIGAGGMVK